MALTAAQILGANDLPILSVDVPEWGGEVCIRMLTGAEREQFESRFLKWQNGSNKSNDLRCTLVALCACDEAGKALFSKGDAEKLNAKSAKALDRVFHAALKHNRITQEDVEELEKN